jgi:hypothetical protein
MEAYPKTSACTKAIQAFTNGWVYGLSRRGYLAGMYSSLCSGILDQVAGLPTARFVLNAIWIAAWNNTPNIFGFGSGACPLSDGYWVNQRVHQYQGGHDETWGGLTISIDSDASMARRTGGRRSWMTNVESDIRALIADGPLVPIALIARGIEAPRRQCDATLVRTVRGRSSVG